MRLINKFLLRNFPFLWKSKIHYAIIFALALSILGFFVINLSFAKVHDKNSFNIMFVMFSLFILPLAWLYSQYSSDSILHKYSLGEFSKMILLYSISFAIYLTPIIIFAVAADDYYLSNNNFGRKGDNLEVVLILGALIYIPTIFLSPIIKLYDFSEIIITTIIGILYISLIMFMLDTFDVGELYIIYFLIANYFVFLGYIIKRILTKKYTKFDKWLIFILILTCPIIMSFLFTTLFTNDKYIGLYLTESSASEIGEFLLITSCFLFLFILTWQITRFLRRPINY